MAYTTTVFKSTVPGAQYKVYLDSYYAGLTPLSLPLNAGMLTVGAGYIDEGTPFTTRAVMLGALDNETVLLPNLDVISGVVSGMDIWPLILLVGGGAAIYFLTKKK